VKRRALPSAAWRYDHRIIASTQGGSRDGVRRTACRRRLSPLSFAVAEHADLEAWARWLDTLGVENSGVVDTGNPVPYSMVVFRHPDHIQLGLIYLPR
jgi:glyoxylase I family protein